MPVPAYALTPCPCYPTRSLLGPHLRQHAARVGPGLGRRVRRVRAAARVPAAQGLRHPGRHQAARGGHQHRALRPDQEVLPGGYCNSVNTRQRCSTVPMCSVQYGTQSRAAPVRLEGGWWKPSCCIGHMSYSALRFRVLCRNPAPRPRRNSWNCKLLALCSPCLPSQPVMCWPFCAPHADLHRVSSGCGKLRTRSLLSCELYDYYRTNAIMPYLLYGWAEVGTSSCLPPRPPSSFNIVAAGVCCTAIATQKEGFSGVFGLG